MINIQKSQIVYYDGDTKSVTVYFDFDPTVKALYVVPSPAIVYKEGGEPLFSLTKYIKNEGDVAGICYFDVELSVPDAALAAVQQAFPEYVFGQFDWKSADGFFTFDVAGDEMDIAVTPSMYGAQRATFSVQITSDEMLKSFINGFSARDSSVSPFHVNYELATLTKLTGVTATVAYNAEVAVAYEKQFEYKRDSWGNEKEILVGVKKNLQQSGAGSVNISWNVEKTPELEMKINDWAWATLENQVAQAVNIAEKAATSENPVESTSSFSQTYQEDQVIEWIINTGDALDRFPPAIWEMVYHEVDLRQLNVTFSMLGDFTTGDGKDLVEKVDVTMLYSTREPFTFSLLPTSDGESSYTYVAAGDFSNGAFNPSYKFSYKVFYNGQQPYVSPEFTSQGTQIAIDPSLLGLRKVTFVGSNIPFTGSATKSTDGETVDKVIIDFFFTRPEGVPNKVDQKIMTANGNGNNAVVFESHYNLPLENTYTYQCTYLYNNNKTITVEPTQAFGSQNSDTVLIVYPYQKNEFTLKARKPVKDGSSILQVDVTVEYKSDVPADTQFSWAPEYKDNTPIVQSTPWEFYAPKNLSTAYFELNGSIYYSDEDAPINNLRLPATSLSLMLSGEAMPYTITIDPSQVAWDEVTNIYVHLFEMVAGQTLDQSLLSYYLPYAPAGQILDKKKVADELGKTKNVVSYSLLNPNKLKPLLYYNIQRLLDSDSLSFYISVEYVQNDGTKKYLDETEVTDKTIFSLPPNGDSDSLKFLPIAIKVPQTVA